MASQPDPYRTLGLDRTASLDDVRRAYRRLAKANHPDAAGESALPRFLAIQSAYDRLVGSRPPWQADPARSDATHRAYGGRARRPAQEDGHRAGPQPGPRTGSRSDWTPRKATLGSTSYDGASHDALEPDWEGASWYGTSSGTYWTTNPREYADPRKHGPEYQARARRDAGAARATTDDAAAGAPVSSDAPSIGRRVARMIIGWFRRD